MKNLSLKLLEKLDKEDKKFADEFFQPVSSGNLNPEDILGFKLPKSRIFVPDRRCPIPIISLYTLLPLYDSIIFPIIPAIDKEKIKSVKAFSMVHGLSPDDIAVLAQKGRVYPRLAGSFSEFDAKLIKPLLEPGIPRVSQAQTHLITRYRLCDLVQSDCKKCEKNFKQARKDFPDESRESCIHCVAILHALGYREKLPTQEGITLTICMAKQIVTARNLDAVFQTECLAGRKSLGIVSELPESQTLEYMLQGIGINYVPEVSLEDYLDILDSKTTKAVRKIVNDILQDPIARKYQQRLSAKIFEFNQQIEELSKSKSAKFYRAISDLVLYGGSKFVERQTGNYVKLPKASLKKSAEWLASKVLDLHSWMTGKDWTIAQLYKARCKLDECKEEKSLS